MTKRDREQESIKLHKARPAFILIPNETNKNQNKYKKYSKGKIPSSHLSDGDVSTSSSVGGDVGTLLFGSGEIALSLSFSFLPGVGEREAFGAVCGERVLLEGERRGAMTGEETGERGRDVMTGEAGEPRLRGDMEMPGDGEEVRRKGLRRRQ